MRGNGDGNGDVCKNEMFRWVVVLLHKVGCLGGQAHYQVKQNFQVSGNTIMYNKKFKWALCIIANVF
jgi:hypothetical protein